MALLGSGRPVRPPLVLAVDLSNPVVDEPATNPLARLRTARRPRLRELTETLVRAGDDARVRALVVRVDRPAETWAHAEEVREAVAAFRRSGKRAVAHAQSFGETGDATLAYYVATAFGEIHLQPTGEVGLTGLAAEVPFVADLLDKLDVEAEVAKRHEYKTAADRLTERQFSQAHRETVDRIVSSYHEQLVAGIAAGRDVDEERAAALVDGGPLRGPEAFDAGLVDRLAYRDETVADVKASVDGSRARLISLSAYRSARPSGLWPRRRTTVAVVHGQGPVHVGRSRRSVLRTTMGADTVVTGFQQALRDRRVRAILFRVDSPGGSAVASDAIWRAVVRAREAGKPVVVTMGSLAGSGGYWVSVGADRVVAAPGTLTGSIGVVSGKLVTRRLRQRLGITTDEVHRGSFALMRSHNHPFTEEHWDRLNAHLDHIYDEFVDKVASERGLPRERVDELARGRVWTGADAATHGLVDDCGGYETALAAARELVGLTPRAPLRLRELPRQSLPEKLGLRQPEPEDTRALVTAARRGLQAVGLLDTGPAAMPGWTSSFPRSERRVAGRQR